MTLDEIARDFLECMTGKIPDDDAIWKFLSVYWAVEREERYRQYEVREKHCPIS